MNAAGGIYAMLDTIYDWAQIIDDYGDPVVSWDPTGSTIIYRDGTSLGYVSDIIAAGETWVELSATDGDGKTELTIYADYGKNFPGEGVYTAIITDITNTSTASVYMGGPYAVEAEHITLDSSGRVDIGELLGSSSGATRLREIADYLMASAATLSTVIDSDSVLGQLLAKSAVTNFDRTKHSQERLGELLSGTGAGTYTATFNDQSTGDPVEGYKCWVTKDTDGNDLVQGPEYSQPDGTATFLLPTGTTYYLWAYKEGKESLEAQPIEAT